MSVVAATLADPDSRLLDVHVAFMLAAGVDVVLLGGREEAACSGAWRSNERVRFVGRSSHTDLARVAVADHDAAWIVPSRADEFWWPRGESLAEVLAVIPDRYRVVQALVRTFVGSPEPGSPFFETMTVRTSLLGPGGANGARPRDLLRPAYRSEPEIVVDEEDWTLRGRRVPLRGWYPIEVLRFPTETPVLPGDVEALLDEGTLVEDTRLRDLLLTLDASSGRVDRMAFPVPTVVEDALYAVECTAVAEVDLPGLDRQIRELELRLAALEARFWPSVRRRLRRLLRR